MQYKTLIIRDLVELANKIDGVYKTLTNTDLVGLANIVATKDFLIKSFFFSQEKIPVFDIHKNQKDILNRQPYNHPHARWKINIPATQ